MASIFEAMRILKLKYYNSIVDHFNDLQRDPDSALLSSLLERRQGVLIKDLRTRDRK